MRIEYVGIRWNDNLPVFSSENYLKSISAEYGWIGGFAGDILAFVLPYVIHRKYTFRYAQFQTSTICMHGEISSDAEREFLNGVIDFLKQQQIDFIVQPPTNAVFDEHPDNCMFAPFGTYILDLGLTEDELWANIHQKHRNVIRKAQKNEVQIERGIEHVDIAYDLLKQTMDRSNMAFYDRERFHKFVELLGGNVEAFIALHDGEPQGCAVFPFSNYSAYYLYGGSIDGPFLGSVNLLHWEAIKHFKSLGVKRYDFVGARITPEAGSKLEGIQRFKSRFGATMKTGYLWKAPLNRHKYNLYKSLLYVRDKGHGDIIDQERVK